MKKNWIVDEAMKDRGNRHYAILENPDSKKQLDSLLIKQFWPHIYSCLEKTGYSFSKKRYPTKFELSPTHERSLLFMLFDNKKPIFRGTLKCSLDGWMIESEFFLLLKKENDVRVILELLGNSRFCGFPPELSVHKGDEFYFQILFKNGRGAGWGLRDENFVKKSIEKVVQTNVDMYEFSKRGIISQNTLAPFLSTAYEVYEAY